MNRLRNIALTVAGAVGALAPTSVFALDFIADQYSESLENTGITGAYDPVDITLNIITWVLGVLGVVALILVLIGGFMWMTSGGNVEKIKKAKKLLIAALIGLVIILSAYGVSQYVFETLYYATG